MAKKRGGLGRGLDALFADAASIYEEEQEETAAEEEQSPPKKKAPAKREKKSIETEDTKDRILYIDINDIKPNKDQPRKTFNKDRIRDLADSILENGVIQPLIVRKAANGYELVAGERRWRASREAGLSKVPCIVRDFDEKQNMIVAIIENMQREDLDAIEEAAGLQAMAERFHFTQEQISSSLGKSRAYIANSLRLLKLPEVIQQYVKDGKMSAAHGRTLINIEDTKKQLQLAERIVKEGLSVRETERLADHIKDEVNPKRKKQREKDADMAVVESELRTQFGTKVLIRGTQKKGKIEFEYYSMEELNRLIEALRKAK